jgi:hypothetical protein
MPGKPSYPIGQISLFVQFGTPQHFHTDYVNFVVADFNGVYHAILGRPGIAKFMAVLHYGYLVLKMPTDKGTLSLRGNILMAHACETSAYATAEVEDLKARMGDTVLESKTLAPSLLEILVKQCKRSAEKSKEHKSIPLVPGDPEKTTLIGVNLSPK